MTAIVAVAGYRPAAVSLGDVAEELGLTSGQVGCFQRFYGFERVCAAPETQDADAVLRAAQNLGDVLSDRADDVRYVIRARTALQAAPYPLAPVLDAQQRLGLRNAQSFTVTHHLCASGLLGLDLAGRLLEADGDPRALALLLLGDLAFSRVGRSIANTTVMGEGTAAVLVAADGDRDVLRGYASLTEGSLHDEIQLSPQGQQSFGRIYVESTAAVVRAAVAEAGIGLGDLALILPHHVNRLSWEKLCAELGVPLELVYDRQQAAVGHCFCADAFLNHESGTAESRLRPGDHYLMTAVGLGATFSAMVLRH